MERERVFLVSSALGVDFIGTEGDEANTASVWHTEALIQELGTRAWAEVFSIFVW